MNKAKKPTMLKSRFGMNSFALSAVAAAMVSMASQGAYAQTADDERAELEEVVVTGIRSSLQRAAELKRNASGVVDAISAEDIGKFPDTNLAESLQRITGVSIDRSNNEGNQITVRGFGPRFNLVTLNGRTLPTSSPFQNEAADRSFRFNELSSASVAAVEVYKSARAELPTGGLGSTVNIRTAKPFDYDGFKGSVVAKATYDESVETGSTINPDVSFLLSNRYLDGKLGLLVSASTAERSSRIERGNTFLAFAPGFVGGPDFDLSGNQNPEGQIFTPSNFSLESIDTERQRDNAQFVVQYAPNENFEIALDYTLSRFDEQSINQATSFWFEFVGTRSGFSNADGVLSQSDINADVDFNGLLTNQVSENDSFGINLDWAVNDRLSLNLDAHSSVSESQPNGESSRQLVGLQSVQNVSIFANFLDGNDVPDAGFSSATGPLFPERLDLFQNNSRQVRNEIDEIKLVGNYTFEDSSLTSIKFGVQRTEFDYDSQLLSTDQRFFNEADSSQGLNIADSFPNLVSDFALIDRGGLGSEFSGDLSGLGQIGTFDVIQTIANLEASGRVDALVSEDTGANEESNSFFIQANFEGAIAGLPLTTNVGVRYEETDVVGRSVTLLPTGLRSLTEEQLDFELGAAVATLETGGSSYDATLPSVDFKLDVTDTFVTRFSYSEGLTRSPIAALAPSTNIGALRPNIGGVAGEGFFQAIQGNPGIQPAISENLDLSFEWYYKEGSYASIGLFDKSVNAFIATEIVNGTLPAAGGGVLRDPSLNVQPGCPGPTCIQTAANPEAIFEITRLANSDEEGSVRGAELALQHVFESGFGVIFNYTYTDGNAEFDTSNFDEQDGTSLVGLGDSANAVLFYERGPLSARIAYNWRDGFLNGFGFNNEPRFTEAFEQIDFTASYDINDNLTVFVEGLNLNDETQRTHGRSTSLLDTVNRFGSRYSLGVRGSF